MQVAHAYLISSISTYRRVEDKQKEKITRSASFHSDPIQFHSCVPLRFKRVQVIGDDGERKGINNDERTRDEWATEKQRRRAGRRGSLP